MSFRKSVGRAPAPQGEPLKESEDSNGKDKELAARLKPTPYATESDFIDLLYTPHTIFFGTLAFSVVLLAYLYSPSSGVENNVKLGLGACAWALLWFGTVQLPDGVMVRPHPAVWRFVCSAALIYLLSMIFFLFQDRATTQFLIGYLEPKSLMPRKEKSYAEDCRISTPEDPNLWIHLIFDEFLLAHALGYVVKVMIIRDWRIVMTVSLLFEVMEVTFQHLLENFKECWWDHLIADVLICNAGGMIVGLLICRYLNAKHYDWVKVAKLRGVKAKAKRLVLQFYPRSFDAHRWEMFKSSRRFLQVLVVIVMFMVQELNAFFLKYLLNLETTSPLVVGRLALWASVAIPGFREFYEFISNPTKNRIGTVAWVGVAGIAFETVWIFKLAAEGGHFQTPAPPHIILPWIYSLCAGVVWFVLFFGTSGYRTTQRGKWHATLWKMALNVLLHSVWISWLALCCMGNADTQWLQKDFDRWAIGQHLYPLPWHKHH